MGAESQPSRPDVSGLGHFAAREELLHGEFDVAGELDGAGHVDHGAGLGIDRGAGLEVDIEDGIRVAVVDAIRAAMEGAAICGGRRGGCMMLL